MVEHEVNDCGNLITLSATSPRDDLKMWSRSDKHIWLGTLFCGCAALYAARTSMPVTVVAIAEEQKWSKTDTGTVLSSFFWGYCLTQVIGGNLADRFGGEFVLMTAAVGWSLVTFWTPQIIYTFQKHDVALTFLVFARILMGACQGVHFPSVTSLSSQRLLEQERTLFYSSVSSGVHLGTIFSGSIGSVVLENFGWQSVFHIIGILGISWALFLRYFVIERQRQKQQALAIKLGLSSSPKTSPKNTSVPWMALFRRKEFWAMIVSHLCESNSTYILISWLPTYFHESFPGSKGWIYNVVPWLICVPSSIFGGWMAEKLIARGCSVSFVRKLMETITQLGKAFFLILIGYVSSFHAALCCMGLALAAGSFHNCAVFINPQDIAPNYAGSVFGLMNMAGAIPGFVGVYMAGHILEVTNSWAAVFNATALVNIIGAVAFLMFGTGRAIV